MTCARRATRGAGVPCDLWRVFENWSRRAGLNRGPADYEASSDVEPRIFIPGFDRLSIDGYRDGVLAAPIGPSLGAIPGSGGAIGVEGDNRSSTPFLFFRRCCAPCLAGPPPRHIPLDFQRHQSVHA